MKFKILDTNGLVINTIIGELDFVRATYVLFEVIEVPTSDVLGTRKTEAIAKVKSISASMSPVTIDTITYNGGDSSAGAISGAIQLAQALGELNVKLWDVDNTIRTYTFEDAQTVAAQIAKAYRDAKYSDYAKIAAINACTTIEELNLVVI